jgi:hypothetical protein
MPPKSFYLITELSTKRCEFKGTVQGIVDQSTITVSHLCTLDGRAVYSADMVPLHLRPHDKTGHIEPHLFNIKSSLTKHGGHHPGQPLEAFYATVNPATPHTSEQLIYDGHHFYRFQLMVHPQGIDTGLLPADEGVSATMDIKGVPHRCEMTMEYSSDMYVRKTINLETGRTVEHVTGRITPKQVKLFKWLCDERQQEG